MERPLVRVERGVVSEAPGALAGRDPLAEFLTGQLSEQTTRAYRADISRLLHFLRTGQGQRRHSSAAEDLYVHRLLEARVVLSLWHPLAAEARRMAGRR